MGAGRLGAFVLSLVTAEQWEVQSAELGGSGAGLAGELRGEQDLGPRLGCVRACPHPREHTLPGSACGLESSRVLTSCHMREICNDRRIHAQETEGSVSSLAEGTGRKPEIQTEVQLGLTRGQS